MFIKLFLCVSILMLFVNYAEDASFFVTYNDYSNVVLKEDLSLLTSLEFNIVNIPQDIEREDCAMWCSVNSNIKYPMCNLRRATDSVYIHARLEGTRELTRSSHWKCSFTILNRKNTTYMPTKFNLLIDQNTTYPETSSSNETLLSEKGNTRLFIEIGLGVTVLVIIAVLMISTLYYRCKANTAVVWTSTSNKPDNSDKNTDDPAIDNRYTTMPTQPKSKTKTGRESCIYEALDNIRGNNSDAPLPPPIVSIPRTTSRSHLTSAPMDSPVSTIPRSPLGMMKKPEPKPKNITLDRIKERPPLPTPSEDVYEDMNSTSPPLPIPPRRLPAPAEEFVALGSLKKQELIGNKMQFCSQKLPGPSRERPIVPGSPEKTHLARRPGIPMNSPMQPMQISQSQLQLELKNRVTGGQSAHLPPVEASAFPKRSASDKLPRPPAPAKPIPRPGASVPPPLKLLPKPAPNTPVQIPVRTVYEDDSDDSEDWTYEPLPHYENENIYNNQ